MKASCRLASFLAVPLCALVCLPARSGSGVTAPAAAPGSVQKNSAAASAPAAVATTPIPGPLRSFLRMAGISQKVAPDEVLPLLSREVAVKGYQTVTVKTGKAPSAGRSTEYLLLLQRYLKQARELQVLAGPEGVIRVSNCSDAQPLLAILGYGLAQACGPKVALQTDDAEKAFLAVDSGFPLTNLEESLRSGQPFVYPYAPSRVPVLFSEGAWTAVDNKSKGDRIDVVDSLLLDPAWARLYWSMSRLDAQTASSLAESPGLKKLLPLTAVVDFYGTHIFVRDGRVVVPGGDAAAAEWKNLVGASPDSPTEFVTRLLNKDEGWLAAYFDALSSVSRTQQAYFVQPARLQHFYQALRGRDLSPSPIGHTFQPDASLFLLISRLQFDANGQPHVPGNLDAWKEIVRRRSDSKIVRDWSGRAKDWNNPEQLIEGMFAFSRATSNSGPLQIYLTLSEIDRRPAGAPRLSPETVRALAQQFPRFHDQYSAFTEFHNLNDASINNFLSVAQAADRIHDQMLRADTLGILQANINLWQILARQGQIPEARLNGSWQGVIGPFAKIPSTVQLFDAARTSLGELLSAASGEPNRSQDELIALLAGPQQASSEGQQVRQQLADKMRVVLDDQRLVSLDTLFALGDGLNQLAAGKTKADALLPLAAELRDFEMPHPIFTTRERAETAARMYNNRHAALQPRTDLTKLLKSGGSREELTAARGQLTPFLRDTLVGLNYAYYEPPGAQMLHHNPIFVRSHDFSGEAVAGGGQSWQTPSLDDRGQTTSGGAYLAGSLADLPYVLVQVEQDFIVPENVQSLIWEDLVPDLVAEATLPRWWNVTPNELHAVALYQKAGEELVSAAANDDKLRQTVMGILSDRMLPQRAEQIDSTLRSGQAKDAAFEITPAESVFLTAQFRKTFPNDTVTWGSAGKELAALSNRYPAEVGWERLSQDFGIPHPVLTQSYVRELLVVPPPPAFLGYSSRMLAESWESNNLYWARLADQMGYQPATLNRVIPELTRRMVEKIFATHPDDWLAMQRAMRETGDEFSDGKLALVPAGGTAKNP